jgi:hypothetical protein
MQVKSESERENLWEEVKKCSNMKAPRFQNSGRFAGFVANNEMNNSRRWVMELLVFW